MKALLCVTSLAIGLAGGCLPDPSGTMQAPMCSGSKWIPPKRITRPCPEPANPCDYEEPLNLCQMIDIALRNNPNTEQSWRNARSAAYDVGVSEAALYPSIVGTEVLRATGGVGGGGLTVTNNLAGDDIASPVTGGKVGGGAAKSQSINVDLSISYLLLDFGGTYAGIASACQALLAANWTHNRSVQTVIIGAIRGYYNLAYAMELVDVREQDLHDAEQNLDAAQGRFQAGIGTKVDVLQAQANSYNARLQLITAQGSVKTTMGQLATALGWAADTPVNVVRLPRSLPVDAITDDICHLVDAAKDSRPDLAAAYSTFLEARANAAVIRSSGMPSVTFGADLQRTKLFGQPKKRNSTQSAFLSLSVPIFEGYIYDYQTASACETASSAFAAWKITELQVMLDVVTAYYTYTTATESLDYSEEYLKYAQEAYDAALEGYRAGVNSLIDLLNAETTLSDARGQWVQSRTQYLTSISGVAYAVGTL